MIMWNKLLAILLLVQAVYGAALEEALVTNSFEFLDKYTQKQYRNVVVLTLSNASITKVDPRLKYLKNLRELDLSHNNVQISSIPTLNKLRVLKLNGNNLKSINMSLLPQNVENVDLSNNLLQHLPKEWRLLKSLKVLYLHKNPIDCDCNNVFHYERLVKTGIFVPETAICHSPKKYLGKDIASVNCSLDDIMLDDEPYEGSGSPDIFQDNLSKANIPLFEEEDPSTNITIIDDFIEVHTTTTEPLAVEEVMDEGSGDEGSGFIINLPESGILGCIENCSTPAPLGGNDEEHASPLPSFLDQLQIIFEDLNPSKKFDDVITTTAVSTPPNTAVTVPLTTSTTTDREKPLAHEPRILKEQNKLTSEKISDKDVELLSNSNNTNELERASTAPQNSNAVYAIAAIFSFLAILFVIFFIKKRRTRHRNNKNRRENANPTGEEMKPLSKPNIQTLNEKPTKLAQNTPEDIPLINGQNGAHRSDSPVLKSFTPLAHPERVETEEEPLQQNGQMVADADEVEFRPHQPEPLTPQRERVTIRESEIPESIPRTPLLVHRQKNSDGEIITTIVP